MEFAEWSDKLSVDIELIDDQHKRLIDLINETSKLILNNDTLKVKNILEELLQWTETHFSEEEEMFTGSGYPDVDKHKGEHKYFVDKIKELEKDHAKNDPSVSLNILQFLKNWFFYHIEIVDITYAPYVKKKILEF